MSITLAHRLPLACSLLVSACAGTEDERRRVEALDAPYMVSDHENGLCGRLVAVDRNGQVWAERGCENGEILLAKIGHTITAAERARVDAAFAALPASGCAVNGTESVMLRRHDGTKETRWYACANADGSLRPPWAEADASLAALAPWPLSLR